MNLRNTTYNIVLGLALLAGSVVHAATLQEFEQRVAKAERDSDLDGVLALVTELQAFVAEHPDKDAYLTLGRATLVAAEIRRYDYENGKDMDPRDRRLLGRTIDDVARIGHDALDKLPNDISEKWRIKADLYATMIRSSYKGEKYVGDMDSATEKALKLDPKNPYALLTATKRPLFAEPIHGGDVKKAMDLLTRALEINPNFERAIAFRGVAYKKMGDMDKAVADWKRALELNPNSGLAKDELAAFEKGEKKKK